MDNNELSNPAISEPAPAQKRKAFFIRFVITFGAGLVAAFLLMLLRGAFSAETKSDAFRLVSDGFSVAGVILLCVGALIFTSNMGTFTMLSYSVSLWGKLFRKDLSAENRSYYEYRKRKLAKKSPVMHFIISGAVLILIGIVFIILM